MTRQYSVIRLIYKCIGSVHILRASSCCEKARLRVRVRAGEVAVSRELDKAEEFAMMPG